MSLNKLLSFYYLHICYYGCSNASCPHGGPLGQFFFKISDLFFNKLKSHCNNQSTDLLKGFRDKY